MLPARSRAASPKASNTATAAVIPIANWPTLKATLSGAHGCTDCPTSTPAAIARISTLAGLVSRAPVQMASLTEYVTFSLR